MKPETADCVVTPVGQRPPRTLVVVPTYNEIDNLAPIVERIVKALPAVDILIVDDDSPDGTGRLGAQLAADDPERVYILHRPGKGGLGAAYLAGFAWALDRGYTLIVETDADGSHPPEQLHRLLEAMSAGADVCIGSRYVSGGEIVNWPRRRALLSRSANGYARLMLGADIKDITAGFRVYRSDVLETIGLGDVTSKGYCFQIDLTWRSLRHGFRVVEVPITFVERERGVSKMSRSNILEAAVLVARWGAQHRLLARRRAAHPSHPSHPSHPAGLATGR